MKNDDFLPFTIIFFLVVDVYQEWCGPCQALQGSFKRLKNELGDNLLQFAIVSIFFNGDHLYIF